jgi:hypothetical protein
MKFKLSQSQWNEIGMKNGWIKEAQSSKVGGEFEMTFRDEKLGDFPGYSFDGIAMVTYSEGGESFDVNIASGNIVVKKDGTILPKKSITEGMILNLRNKIKSSSRAKAAVNKHVNSKKAGMDYIQIKLASEEGR